MNFIGMKYQKRFSYIGFVFLLALLYVSFSPLVSVARLYWLDGREYSHFLHENKQLSEQEQRVYVDIVQAAKQKVAHFWGGLTSSPTILFCSTDESFQNVCHQPEGAGCSLGSPFGSWIILNKDNANADVVAHELAHIELMQQVGWWKAKTKIPTWLDEGIALQVDNRFVSSTDSIQRYLDFKEEWLFITFGGRESKNLNDLSTSKLFFGISAYDTRQAYYQSGMEVAKIISIGGRAKLRALIQDYIAFPLWKVILWGYPPPSESYTEMSFDAIP